MPDSTTEDIDQKPPCLQISTTQSTMEAEQLKSLVYRFDKPKLPHHEVNGADTAVSDTAVAVTDFVLDIPSYFPGFISIQRVCNPDWFALDPLSFQSAF